LAGWERAWPGVGSEIGNDAGNDQALVAVVFDLGHRSGVELARSKPVRRRILALSVAVPRRELAASAALFWR
jgi:hypothetical protein